MAKKDTSGVALSLLSRAATSQRQPPPRRAAPAPTKSPESAPEPAESPAPSAEVTEDEAPAVSGELNEVEASDRASATSGQLPMAEESAQEQRPTPVRERPARTRRRRSATEDGENAPRTLRLDQGTANRLREAWLDAKRSDVLLTQQDFAGRMVSRGLPLKRTTTRSVRAAASETSANAPRTLKLDQGTANRLREAWLIAKRDDVLLSHQDFASSVIEAGLAAEERARQRPRTAGA